MLQNNIKYTLAFLGFSLISIGQELKSDVLAINKAYRQVNKMTLTFELNMFENYTTQKVYYTENGLIQKNGKNTYHKFEDNECINTPDYSVMIDKEEKEVVYAPKKVTFDYDDPALALDLDSVLLMCKSHTFKKISGEIYSYQFIMKEGYPDYGQICFYFNPKTYFIQKIIYYCNEDDISLHNDDEKYSKSRVEINYKDINTKPSFNSSDFTYEKYLVKSGNKFELKSSLTGYHLTVLAF